jgi:hypothetical protein
MRRIIIILYALTALMAGITANAFSQGIKPPPTPQFETHLQIVPGKSPTHYRQQPQIKSGEPRPLSDEWIEKNKQQQIHKVMQEMERKEQMRLLKEEMRKEGKLAEYNEYLQVSRIYQGAYAQLMDMGSDSFSVTKSVFIVENAFHNNKLDYSSFAKAIKEIAGLCRQIMKTERLDPNDDLAKNYAIQKLFSGGAQVYDQRTKTLKPVKPLQYDFNDFFGEKDWKKMFVTKLMKTGMGQCHSMPLFYMAVAEELGARSWLALGPEHFYIRFPGGNGNIYNFETTRGKIVSDQALVGSGFITPAAIKSRIYMDTLSTQQMLSLMATDLVLGYNWKLRAYDPFAEQVIDRILAGDPNNLPALLVKYDIARNMFENEADRLGRPHPDVLHQYPHLYRLFISAKEMETRINNLGYQPMPKEAYGQWMQDMKEKEKEQESKQLQEQVKRLLKTTKPAMVNKKKG